MELNMIETIERESYTVKGGKVLIFGDTHFSSSYEGKHISYVQDCYLNMQLIMNHVKEEKPSAIFFVGDLCGVVERNIKDRQFLTRVLMFFGTLYNMTKGNVYSAKGNHDIGDFSDFDMLISLGYVKNPKYVDYEGDDGSPEVRFHFVNYGDEKRRLAISEDHTNVVIGHADYYIDGVSAWYSAKAGVELKKLENFIGVEMVISGHIHTPSENMLYTNLPDGSQVGLFFIGSPSRTSERFNDCWYMIFEYIPEDLATGYDVKLMGLPPASSVFHEDSEFIGEEEKTEEERHSDTIDAVISEVMNSRIVTGDLFKQIDMIPANEDEKEIAKTYLRRAMEGK